jgi:hypothetical protein
MRNKKDIHAPSRTDYKPNPSNPTDYRPTLTRNEILLRVLRRPASGTRAR